MKEVPQYDQLDFHRSQIAKYLKKLRFKPRLFGVDQADVWKKLEELNSLYETALLAERARYDALLEAVGAAGPRDPGEGGGV